MGDFLSLGLVYGHFAIFLSALPLSRAVTGIETTYRLAYLLAFPFDFPKVNGGGGKSGEWLS
jgi:hypothetical protein